MKEAKDFIATGKLGKVRKVFVEYPRVGFLPSSRRMVTSRLRAYTQAHS